MIPRQVRRKTYRVMACVAGFWEAWNVLAYDCGQATDMAIAHWCNVHDIGEDQISKLTCYIVTRAVR
jgi:hypothetical protein